MRLIFMCSQFFFFFFFTSKQYRRGETDDEELFVLALLLQTHVQKHYRFITLLLHQEVFGFIKCSTLPAAERFRLVKQVVVSWLPCEGN